MKVPGSITHMLPTHTSPYSTTYFHRFKYINMKKVFRIARAFCISEALYMLNYGNKISFAISCFLPRKSGAK